MIPVPGEVGLVADGVFPKTLLPKAAEAFLVLTDGNRRFARSRVDNPTNGVSLNRNRMPRITFPLEPRNFSVDLR